MRTLERSGTNTAGMKWVWWRWWIRWKWWRGVGPSWVITGCRRIKGDADFSPVVLLLMDTVCNSAEPCTSKCEIFAAVPQSVLCYYSSFIVLLVDLISNLNCEVLLKLMYQPFRENLWSSGFTMACSTATLLNTVLHCTVLQDKCELLTLLAGEKQLNWEWTRLSGPVLKATAFAHSCSS